MPDSLSVSVQTRINAPLEKAWQVLTDFGSYHTWHPILTLEPHAAPRRRDPAPGAVLRRPRRRAASSVHHRAGQGTEPPGLDRRRPRGGGRPPSLPTRAARRWNHRVHRVRGVHRPGGARGHRPTVARAARRVRDLRRGIQEVRRTGRRLTMRTERHRLVAARSCLRPTRARSIGWVTGRGVRIRACDVPKCRNGPDLQSLANGYAPRWYPLTRPAQGLPALYQCV